MKLYVGNLSYQSTEQEIRNYFESVGPVEAVELIVDRDSGRPRGFGFVTMGSPEDAQRAVEQYDGQEFGGRRLVVNHAREKERRGGRGEGRGERRRRDY